RLGELVVDFDGLRRLDRNRGRLEFRRLTGQLRIGVVLWERDLQRPRLAGGDPGQLLFETGNKGIGANRDLDIFARAAIERRAVNRPLEVDRNAVAGRGLGALALVRIAAVLVGNALDRLVDIGVGHLSDRLLDVEALEIGELNGWHHFDGDRVI